MTKKPTKANDKIIDDCLAHLGNLVTAEAMLRKLDSGSLNAAAFALMAMLHAQENDGDFDGAQTPIETLQYVVPQLNDHARNAVGSIACAIVNMQQAAQRDPKAVFRLVKNALRPERQRKTTKKKG